VIDDVLSGKQHHRDSSKTLSLYKSFTYLLKS